VIVRGRHLGEPIEMKRGRPDLRRISYQDMQVYIKDTSMVKHFCVRPTHTNEDCREAA